MKHYVIVVQKENQRFVFAGWIDPENKIPLCLEDARVIVSSRYPADVLATGLGFSKLNEAYLSVSKKVTLMQLNELKTIIYPDKKTIEMIESHKDNSEDYFYEKEEKKPKEKKV